MSQKILLITGGSGYLGRPLTAKAVDSFQVYTTYSRHPDQIKAGQASPLDLTRRDDVLRLVGDLSPQAIIHAAAVNPGQGDDETMRQVNALGSRYIAEAAVAVGARLVHVSSDMVHDGKHAPYADDAPPSPLSGYGRSKAEAEAAVAEIDPTAAVVRTSLIYGLAEMDRGTEGFVARLRANQPLVLFSDAIRQPVWVESLAGALLKLAAEKADFAGLLNVAGRQVLSREEFGRRMLQWWQVDPGDRLQSGRAADISAAIPLDLRLSVSKAEQILQMRLPGVDEVLAQGVAK
ncbi:MAG: sugar nucleotide-binding protein [Anaerolineales bacterium]|nr:sugar nucleotide-binding protein [Anaerolineales bacterium]